MKNERWSEIWERTRAIGAMDLPYGSIQWKGTNVCIDLHCVCGEHSHVDAEFFYRFQCPECGRKYHVSANVKLIEATPDEVADYEADGHDFIVGFT